jgi:hypothetical protein
LLTSNRFLVLELVADENLAKQMMVVANPARGLTLAAPQAAKSSATRN